MGGKHITIRLSILGAVVNLHKCAIGQSSIIFLSGSSLFKRFVMVFHRQIVFAFIASAVPGRPYLWRFDLKTTRGKRQNVIFIILGWIRWGIHNNTV